MPRPLIIAIDLDNFYVACECLKDPSLASKPIGIVQKSILATCSYAAREFGVPKLSSISDALKLCPDLILINGEDLTKYRDYSKQIWSLIKSILPNVNIERLGMDEFFFDVTNLVDNHYRTCYGQQENIKQYTLGNEMHFDIHSSDNEVVHSFAYKVGHTTGFIEPSNSNEVLVNKTWFYNHDHRNLHRLAIASHLAQEIRNVIEDRLGFTTSAGISHSKEFAKLLAATNKPAKQTLWFPAHDQETFLEQEFLASYPLRKIPGFGYQICQSIAELIFIKKNEEEPIEASKLSVMDVRENMTLDDFHLKFGQTSGTRLYNLLWARDDEQVKNTPEYPLQISVEESFARSGLTKFNNVCEQLQILSESLLRRLEHELCSNQNNSNPPSLIWERYPSQIRLTIRSYNNNSPTILSKSAKLPVFVFDLDIDRKERAQRLYKTTIKRLLSNTWSEAQSVTIHVLNLAVTHLSTDKPTQSVATLFSQSTSSPLSSTSQSATRSQYQNISSNDIDISILNELPPDVQQSIIDEYGLGGSSSKPNKKDSRNNKRRKLEDFWKK